MKSQVLGPSPISGPVDLAAYLAGEPSHMGSQLSIYLSIYWPYYLLYCRCSQIEVGFRDPGDLDLSCLLRAEETRSTSPLASPLRSRQGNHTFQGKRQTPKALEVCWLRASGQKIDTCKHSPLASRGPQLATCTNPPCTHMIPTAPHTHL